MLRRSIVFVLPIALAVCASALPGAKAAEFGARAELPDVKVGDKYTETCTEGRRTYDRQTVITSVDQSSIKFTRDGELLENDREGNSVRDEDFLHTGSRKISFPLEVGKTWTWDVRWQFLHGPSHGSGKGKATVVAYEKVRVPTGEFDAFKVRWTVDWQAVGKSGQDIGTYWYAPATRTLAKSTARMAPYPEQVCELKEFQLQP